MARYRFYCLDLGGQKIDALEIEVASDEEALDKARSMPGLSSCEVWRDRKLVGKVDYSGSALAQDC